MFYSIAKIGNGVMTSPDALPETMSAVRLTGHGGFDRLEYRTDVHTPRPKPGEVLINVAAAGVNNTDTNTRIGCTEPGRKCKACARSIDAR